jgi:hypothetical protein
VRRTVKLARLAAEAESLRLRTMLRRYATRAVLAVVAIVFLLATLAWAEVTAARALALTVQPVYAALIMLGINLVIGVIFLAIAASGKPSAVEVEALEVRKTAQAQIARTMAITALIGPLMRLLGARKFSSLLVAGLTARYLGARR